MFPPNYITYKVAPKADSNSSPHDVPAIIDTFVDSKPSSDLTTSLQSSKHFTILGMCSVPTMNPLSTAHTRTSILRTGVSSAISVISMIPSSEEVMRWPAPCNGSVKTMPVMLAWWSCHALWGRKSFLGGMYSVELMLEVMWWAVSISASSWSGTRCD